MNCNCAFHEFYKQLDKSKQDHVDRGAFVVVYNDNGEFTKKLAKTPCQLYVITKDIPWISIGRYLYVKQVANNTVFKFKERMYCCHTMVPSEYSNADYPLVISADNMEII